MAADVADPQVRSVRHFNRFYTRQMGLLEEHLLTSPFTLTQARVLFELGTQDMLTAGDISTSLELDRGYLSRILNDFVAQDLISQQKSKTDRRRVFLSLTGKGKQAFRTLDRESHCATAKLLSKLSGRQQEQLVRAIQKVEVLLSSESTRNKITIRTHQIGDIGWAIEQHGRLYAEEYGWNYEFEALVTTLFAQFASKHDPEIERCWIAEVNGDRAGCVFVVRNEEDSTAAQLRCLLVDPRWRGFGLGRRLVDECLLFAKDAGYTKIVLWTNDVLVAARKIYEATGFKLVKDECHHSFGHDLVGQVFSRDL
jgi:DNA-binding MarR family transcriptional regulator/GNAT superfamily N-acetyltransferase